VLLVAAGLAPAAKHRPNVVFICTDQQHAAMLSCAGNPYVKTPAIDSLARNGARFERAYCTNPVCLPSRFSMLSGVLPSRVGLEMNAPANVPEAILTHAMGRVFRDAGYETAYGGKVHTPMPLAAIGFEKLSDDERQGLAEACTQFLNKKHDRPFLLVASFVNPHDICFMVIKDYFRATGHRDRALDMADALQPALSEALKSPSGMSRDEFFAKVCPPLPANFEIPPGEPENLLPAKMPSFRTYARQNWTPVQSTAGPTRG
jgi:choline-sulfatase